MSWNWMTIFSWNISPFVLSLRQLEKQVGNDNIHNNSVSQRHPTRVDSNGSVACFGVFSESSQGSYSTKSTGMKYANQCQSWVSRRPYWHVSLSCSPTSTIKPAGSTKRHTLSYKTLSCCTGSLFCHWGEPAHLGVRVRREEGGHRVIVVGGRTDRGWDRLFISVLFCPTSNLRWCCSTLLYHC